MSVPARHAPLGGFEERLLAELMAHIATRPATVLPPSRSSQARHRPRLARGLRLSLPATAAAAAVATGLLSLLPVTVPALAQAFPVLSGRTRALPARFARVLRAQWVRADRPRFDLGQAHAFQTPAGTGYAIIDRRSRWLCILIPGFSAHATAGRCERVALARTGELPLTLRISGGSRGQEIVALLSSDATASAATGAARVVPLKSHRGVVTIVTHGSVTLTTTVDGRRGATVTYMP